VSRVDKYEPLSGGSRAALGFTLATNQVNVVLGVGLDTSGRLQLGAANTGIIGVICLEKIHTTGQIVDVMQDGDIVEFPGVAGTNYFADGVSGALVAGTGTATNTGPAAANSKKVGFTVEAASGLARLVVRTNRA
jgi:hypothetical protein